jgi:hypothetical protein
LSRTVLGCRSKELGRPIFLRENGKKDLLGLPVSSAGATDRARGDRLCNRDSGHFRRASGLYAVSGPDLAWGDIKNIAPLAAL